MKIERELMRGAGPIAVLSLLSSGEMYGYELVKALSQRTDGVLDLGQSTLYPMLYNLEAKGLVASRVDEGGARPRKYYRLTGKGKKRLAGDTKQWNALAKALGQLGVGTPGVAGGGA
ncbi:MAG: PadR family transcriptional regulator [Phycisphaerales bacterium JB063]